MLEVKYVRLLSSQLKHFRQVSQNPPVFNFACPICGDSKRDKKKARGYIVRSKKGSGFYYSCHNDDCSRSISFSKFLKAVDPRLYDEYVLEKMEEGGVRSRPKVTKPLGKKPEFKKSVEKISLPKLSELDATHPAKVYAATRMLTDSSYNLLYYADNVADFINSLVPSGSYKNLLPEGRIVIPFFDPGGKIIGGTARSMSKGSNIKRYITFKLDDAPDPLMFGLERWKPNEKTYLTEGPIDSLFVQNGLAAGGSDLISTMKMLSEKTGLSLDNVIYIFDNEPRSKAIVKLIEKAADMERQIFIWPSNIKAKDLNELYIEHPDQEWLVALIERNTFSGLEAQLNLNQWKKV